MREGSDDRLAALYRGVGEGGHGDWRVLEAGVRGDGEGGERGREAGEARAHDSVPERRADDDVRVGVTSEV